MESQYKPLACSFYDQLESYAARQSTCVIVYFENEKEMSVEAKIVNIVSRDKAEFVELDNSVIIRLDHLLSVNGIPMKGVC